MKDLSHSLVATILFLTLFCSISASNSEAQIVWRAFQSDGDKPGIGYELVEESDLVKGSLYILEPNKPGDFKSGLRIPMVIVKLSSGKYLLKIKFPSGEKHEFNLTFPITVDSSGTKKAIIQEKGDYDPEEFVFSRQ